MTVPELGQSFAAALVVGVAVTVVSGLGRAVIGRGRSGFGAALLDGALAASAVGVVVATMSPLEQLFASGAGPPAINLEPFDRLDGAPPRFAVINLLLLAPTVFLVAQRWRRIGIVRLTLLALALSVSIEVVQLWHPQRGTNIDDVALNTAGASVAAVLGVLVRRLRGAHVPRRRAATGRPALEAEVAQRDAQPVERAG